MNLVCLIGEQPIPNLLPILYLRPQQVLLVHTSNEGSHKAAKRLQNFCAAKQIRADTLDVGDAYSLERIYIKISQKVAEPSQDEWCFNLTGGTKLMSLAAVEVAADLQKPCVYYQTEAERDQRVGKIHWYRMDAQRRLVEEAGGGEVLPSLLTLDDYLRAHVDGYQKSDQGGDPLENAVCQVLSPPNVDEALRNIKPQGVKDQIEIDLLIRIGNQVGVIEVKTGGEGSGKKAIDQLTTAAAREYLGTYAVRFLVTQQAREDRYKALAQALRVEVVELREYDGSGRLTENDKRNLLEKVYQRMPRSTGG